MMALGAELTLVPSEGGLTTKSTEFSGIGVAGIEFGKFAVGRFRGAFIPTYRG